jgi:hypothetical protein
VIVPSPPPVIVPVPVALIAKDVESPDGIVVF